MGMKKYRWWYFFHSSIVSDVNIPMNSMLQEMYSIDIWGR